MKMHEVVAWVEAHPGESVVIGGVSLIFVIYIFGGFSSSSSSDNGSSLAAAYYAAEAQQAVVGGQIQQANIAANASTAQALIGANAATAINSQNTTAATAIDANDTAAAVSANATNVQGALQATQINATAATTINASNNSTALSALNAQINGTEAMGFINKIIPQELAMTGGFGNFFLPSGQTLSVNSGSPAGNVNSFLGEGFSSAQANALALATAGFTSPPIPAFEGGTTGAGG